MSNFKSNKFIISYLLLIIVVSLNGDYLTQAAPLDYLELDICMKGNYGSWNTDLGSYLSSRFNGSLMGCHHTYSLVEIKYKYDRTLHSYSSYSYSSYSYGKDYSYSKEVEFTLVLQKINLIRSEPIYDFHEDYIKQCFEDKNKLDDYEKDVTIKIRGLRNYHTEIEDIVPEYFEVNLQVQLFKPWYLSKFQEVNFLEDLFVSKFDGTLKGCLCNYTIVQFNNKTLLDPSTYNVTLLLQRDLGVPVGQCTWNEHYKTAYDCFMINNHLYSLTSSVRVSIQSAKPVKLNETSLAPTEIYSSETELDANTGSQGELIKPKPDTLIRRFLSNLTRWHGLLIAALTLLLIYCVLIVMYRKRLERLVVDRTKVSTIADDPV